MGAGGGQARQPFPSFQICHPVISGETPQNEGLWGEPPFILFMTLRFPDFFGNNLPELMHDSQKSTLMVYFQLFTIKIWKFGSRLEKDVFLLRSGVWIWFFRIARGLIGGIFIFDRNNNAFMKNLKKSTYDN